MAAQNVWLVTGCSSGLGESIIKAAAGRGQLCIATARRVDSIQHLQSETTKLLQLDVTNCPADLAQQAQACFGRAPNVLLSNAGYGLVGAVEQVTDPELKAQFNTNFFGLLDVLRKLLPGIRSYGDKGWVVNMSSMGSRWSSAGFSSYQSTKHALAAATRSLALELEPHGVHVVAIEPGLVRTPFYTGAGKGYVKTQGKAEGDPYPTLLADKDKSLQSSGSTAPTDSDKCGERVVDLVLGEGGARGRKPPIELPLGREAFDIMKTTLEKKLREMEEWKDFGSNVAVETT